MRPSFKCAIGSTAVFSSCLTLLLVEGVAPTAICASIGFFNIFWVGVVAGISMVAAAIWAMFDDHFHQ